MEHIMDSLVVTVIGMGIIFLVLIILLVTIIALNKIFPYKEPSPVPTQAGSDDTQLVAVIQAAIAKYLGKRAEDVKIKSIK